MIRSVLELLIHPCVNCVNYNVGLIFAQPKHTRKLRKRSLALHMKDGESSTSNGESDMELAGVSAAKLARRLIFEAADNAVARCQKATASGSKDESVVHEVQVANLPEQDSECPLTVSNCNPSIHPCKQPRC